LSTEGQIDRKELIRTIDLGYQVEQFIKSDLGKYLLDRSDAEQKEALNKLGEVDPFDHKAISALQLDLRVAAGIQTWLADLVIEGRNAEAALQELDQK
jgi:hypothetical protein